MKIKDKVLKKTMKLYNEVSGDIDIVIERLKRCSPEYRKQKYVPLHRMNEGVGIAIDLVLAEVGKVIDEMERKGAERYGCCGYCIQKFKQKLGIHKDRIEVLK